MVRWRNIVIPLLVAAFCWLLVPVDFWDANRQALLVCLSVVAAGVLVRLTRALPFTAADQYELDEVRRVTAAITQIARSLRALLKVTLASMIGLVVAKSVLSAAAAVPLFARHITQVDPAISALLGLLVGYAPLRANRPSVLTRPRLVRPPTKLLRTTASRCSSESAIPNVSMKDRVRPDRADHAVAAACVVKGRPHDYSSDATIAHDRALWADHPHLSFAAFSADR